MARLNRDRKVQIVTEDMWDACASALELFANNEPEAYLKMREHLTDFLIGWQRGSKQPFDFSKDFRHGATAKHRLIFDLVNTVEINTAEGGSTHVPPAAKP